MSGKNHNSFAFNHFHTLGGNAPGCGYERSVERERQLRERSTSVRRPVHASRDNSPLIAISLRINSYKSVSKQMTLTIFRMNTYEKSEEGLVQPFRSFRKPRTDY